MAKGYVYCDKDGSTIMVYGSPELDGALQEQTFHRDGFLTREDWQRTAERYAARLAREFDVEWGANW